MKIEIEIPKGKELIKDRNVYKLVDKKIPITEKIKTFKDACATLGEYHPAVYLYHRFIKDVPAYLQTSDILAYYKLRVITAALNEGWEPKFTKNECRYYPWFYFWTKDEYDKLDDEKKGRCVLNSRNYADSYYGFMICVVCVEDAFPYSSNSSQLAFKTKELAEYAGRQFKNLYKQYLIK